MTSRFQGNPSLNDWIQISSSSSLRSRTSSVSTMDSSEDSDKPKRRNRPRGCRGGKKNRKRKERFRMMENQRQLEVELLATLDEQPSANPLSPRSTNQMKYSSLINKKDNFQPTDEMAAPTLYPPRPITHKPTAMANQSVLPSSKSNAPRSFSNDILPPLPYEDQELTVFEGPNPYALGDQQRRLEKQRSAFGGSFFVTSPRSFLMGSATENNGRKHVAW